MRALILVAAALSFAVAAHADDNNKNDNGHKPAGAAKGAAVGALAGHEVGSGHAASGAAVGAAVGHHQRKKAEEQKPQ